MPIDKVAFKGESSIPEHKLPILLATRAEGMYGEVRSFIDPCTPEYMEKLNGLIKTAVVNNDGVFWGMDEKLIMDLSFSAGLERLHRAKIAGRGGRAGSNEKDPQWMIRRHELGMFGEITICAFAGVLFSPKEGTFWGTGDIGSIGQVRASRKWKTVENVLYFRGNRLDGKKDEDKSEDFFISVTLQSSPYIYGAVHGGGFGFEVSNGANGSVWEQPDREKERPFCWCTPNSKLPRKQDEVRNMLRNGDLGLDNLEVMPC